MTRLIFLILIFLTLILPTYADIRGFPYSVADNRYWTISSDQVGITGDKSGSFDLATTGLGTFGQGYINGNSATALLVEQDGVKDNVLVVDTAQGTIGMGAAASDDKLYVYYTPANDTGAYGINVYYVPTATITGSYAWRAASFSGNPGVSVGVTNTSESHGLFVSELTDATLAGTLATIYGQELRYGLYTGTTGTVTTTFGLRMIPEARAGTATYFYNIYIDAESTGATHTNQAWSIYDLSSWNWLLGADNKKLMFGAGKDASIYYNGTNLVIDTSEVGTGYLDLLDNGILTTGTLGAGAITGTSLKSNGTLSILEGGATPTKYTIFQGGDQTVDITYTLPTALGAAGTVLTDVAGDGILSWAAAGGGGASFGTTTQIPYMNVAGDDFLYSANLIFDGTTLTTPNINGSSADNGDITIQGTSSATRTTSYVNLQPSGGFVGIGTTAPVAVLQIGNSPAIAWNDDVNKSILLSSTTNNDQLAYEMYVRDSSNNRRIKFFLDDATSVYGFDSAATAGNPNFKILSNGNVYFSLVNANAGATSGPGNIGIGGIDPAEAKLHIAAGTATASTAPFKLTTGVNNTIAELGTMEFTDPNLYFTITDTTVKRKGIVMDNGTTLTATRVPFATTNGRLTDSANLTFVTDTLTLDSVLTLTGITSDPAAPANGSIWYRSDVHEFRVRDNSTTYRLLIERL